MKHTVELVGPSGIGKSTLYQNLRGIWNPDKDWVSFHDLRFRKPEPVWSVVRWQRFLSRKLFPKPDKMEASSPYNPNPVKRSIESHPELFSTYLDLLQEHSSSSYSGEDRRALNFFWLTETAGHIQEIEDYQLEHPQDERICLLDEGFVSRVMHLSSPTLGEEQIEQYLKRIPVSDTIIILTASTKTIMERIESREKVSTIHSGLSVKERFMVTERIQAHLEYASSVMEKRGSTVIRLEAHRDAKELAEQVNDLLKGLSAK